MSATVGASLVGIRGVDGLTAPAQRDLVGSGEIARPDSGNAHTSAAWMFRSGIRQALGAVRFGRFRTAARPRALGTSQADGREQPETRRDARMRQLSLPRILAIGRGGRTAGLRSGAGAGSSLGPCSGPDQIALAAAESPSAGGYGILWVCPWHWASRASDRRGKDLSSPRDRSRRCCARWPLRADELMGWRICGLHIKASACVARG